jgi:cytochrome c oxidase cbb3-type subunit 3
MRVTGACVLVSALLTAGCRRDRREFARLGPGSRLAETAVPSPSPNDPSGGAKSPFQTNAFGIGQGAILFQWFNCTGCHAQGGGAIGPPLMDEKWIYGAESGQIFASIANGRPNGMPAFGKRLGTDQVWQLVAYVQALSGHVPQDVAPSRNDTMAATKPPSMTKEQPIVPETKDAP